MSTPTIHADPPNRAALEGRFGPLPDTVIVTYAPHIYVPGGGKLTPALEAHETVHLGQQGNDPAGGWERYLADDTFRLEQELEAHRAEWRVARAEITDRNRRTRELHLISRRLASPLYGNMLTTAEATRMVGVAK